MAQEVPRPSLRHYSAARGATSQCLDAYFRTGEDVGVPARFFREDLVGHVAVDARALAAEKEVVLSMFMSASNRRVPERDCSHAAPASCDECPEAFPRHHPRRKNLTPKAPYA